MGATGNTYWDLLPKPPPATWLLTRDEAISLLRARGDRFAHAAEALAADKAGPPWTLWRGQHRYDWPDVFHWGRDYRTQWAGPAEDTAETDKAEVAGM
jgi:hypothetical protein